MIILGIDPGMAVTGYGIIKSLRPKARGSTCKLDHVAHGVIRTETRLGMGERLKKLRLELKKIIKEFKPNCIAIEQHFFGRNSKTAMGVSQARGVILMTMAESRIPLYEYQSLAVKKMLANDGRAEKMKIQETVKKILRMKKHPTPNDAADALALAVYHHLQCLKR